MLPAFDFPSFCTFETLKCSSWAFPLSSWFPIIGARVNPLKPSLLIYASYCSSSFPLSTWSPSESKNDALESNSGKSFSVLSQPSLPFKYPCDPIWGSPAAKKLKSPVPPVLKVLTSETVSPLENLYIYSVSGSNPSKVTWLLEYPERFVSSITVASRTFASLKSFSAFSFANSNFPFSFVSAYHVKFLSVPSFPIVNIAFVWILPASGSVFSTFSNIALIIKSWSNSPTNSLSQPLNSYPSSPSTSGAIFSNFVASKFIGRTLVFRITPSSFGTNFPLFSSTLKVTLTSDGFTGVGSSFIILKLSTIFLSLVL